MEHANGHHEGFFSPTTATYVELLNAAGLVASAARGEPEQRRMLGTFNNVHASYPKVLCMDPPALMNAFAPATLYILTGLSSQTDSQ